MSAYHGLNARLWQVLLLPRGAFFVSKQGPEHVLPDLTQSLPRIQQGIIIVLMPSHWLSGQVYHVKDHLDF